MSLSFSADQIESFDLKTILNSVQVKDPPIQPPAPFKFADLGPNLIPALNSWQFHPERPAIIDNSVLFNNQPTLQLDGRQVNGSITNEVWLPGIPLSEGDCFVFYAHAKCENVIHDDSEGRCGFLIGADFRGYTDNRQIQDNKSPVFHTYKLNTIQGGTTLLSRPSTSDGWIPMIVMGQAKKYQFDSKGSVVWAVPKQLNPWMQGWPTPAANASGIKCWFAPQALHIFKPMAVNV